MEEAKLEFIITVNWRREDGSIAPAQLERHCEAVRPCPGCHRRRHLKDYRCRHFDTVFGRLGVRAPRFDGCRNCDEGRTTSLVSELLPEPVSPELLHLQVKLAAQLPYRQAAALLQKLLPETGGLNLPRHATERSLSADALKKRSARKLIIPRAVPQPVERMVVGIDGALIKAGILRRAKVISLRFSPGASRHSGRGGEAFAVVRDLDPYAKSRVQAILRRRGRGQEHGFEHPVEWRRWIARVVGPGLGRNASIVWMVPCCATVARNRKGIPLWPLWG